MKLILFLQKHAKFCLSALVVVLFLSVFGALKFKIDASADTLINKDDPDYLLSKSLDERYQLKPSLVVVVRPHAGLFTDKGLDLISRLNQAVSQIEGITGTLTLLDVPLFLQSVTVASGDVTLLTPGLDIASASKELISSPLYRDLLVSKEGDTTGIDVSIDPAYLKLFAVKHSLLNQLRDVAVQFRDEGDVYLGGLEVIADDMVMYLKRDLLIFGSLVLVLMVVVLGVLFRRIQWILLAMGCCVASVLAMMGILGALGLKVTVVSSNFVSLQIILTMSLVIHLIVKYEELSDLYPKDSQLELIAKTVAEKFSPSFFASITTIVGFGSLLFSGLVPVAAFGWMMMLGITVSFIITFVLFTCALSLLPKIPTKTLSIRALPIRSIARKTESHRKTVIVLSLLLVVFGITGMRQLNVENSFINYFKKSTDLHQGLAFIDQHLGGTTPLTITIDVSSDPSDVANDAPPAPSVDTSTLSQDEDDFFSDFEDASPQGTVSTDGLTLDKVQLARKVHEHLESLPSTGKVLSVWTTVKMAEIITRGPIGNFELAVLNKTLPESLKAQLLDPYFSEEAQQLRVTLRMLDSDPKLNRNSFLVTLKKDLTDTLGIAPDRFQITGAMVLYNTILQRLFSSQILTLGIMLVLLALVLMLLLRNFKLCIIAIIPNIFSVFVVLGLMGWVNIPLDMMTITIASITVGIAIDDAIHYIYRYKQEFKKDGDYVQSMFRSHRSVGQAMVFTTITISLGFGVLLFSNFIPNIMFGLLTVMAMGIALLSSLTMMALVLVLWKPFTHKKTTQPHP